jgi:hypothetical protein
VVTEIPKRKLLDQMRNNDGLNKGGNGREEDK